VTASLTPEQVLRYRARVSHLDEKLPPGSFAKAAWGGLQDSVPRAGVISLHARVRGTAPDSWEDASVAQIWFRGGADYIVPREDIGVFTLGSYPRDSDRAAEIDRLAADIHRVAKGRTLPVGDVSKLLGHTVATSVRVSALSGRVLIRWDASRIWLIPIDRPSIDVEDARRELARRFVHWFGPTTAAALARWTGVPPREAKVTWAGIEPDLVAVEIAGGPSPVGRFVLASDLEAFEQAKPISGVRLIPFDDAFTKLDHELLLRDAEQRARALPPGYSRGFIPGCVLVDGEIVGVWQRQQRRATIHPFPRLETRVREAIEAEALAFPIAGSGAASVTWAD
jgi:hypothetical protein